MKNSIALTLAALLAPAAAVPRPSADKNVGSTSAFSYPPVSHTLSGDFPDRTAVGYPGPTPTGDEAFAAATAPSYPLNVGYFPLVRPKVPGQASSDGEVFAPDVDDGFNPLRYWGQLSPFYSVKSEAFGLPKASPLIPEGCDLEQIHLLHRHGARYPTSGSVPAKFAAKLHNATVNGTGFSASGDLAFLNKWQYKLGGEILTPFGREQMYNLGVGFRVKYGHLLEGFTKLPVFRTESQDRMIKSSLNFAAGFFGIPYSDQYYQEIIIESPGFNNTLAPYGTCNNSNNAIAGIGAKPVAEWQKKYLASAVGRINSQVSGIEFNITDVYAMQQTCAYETVALGYSAFCPLFTADEWEGYEYSVDLSFWYGNSFGNPASSAMGLGWVQELVARLTKEQITVFNSTTNSTLHSDERFPLDQPIYVDATHDTILSAIFTTLNFTVLAKQGPLPWDHIPKDRSYVVSETSPFGANLQAQVLNCKREVTTTDINAANSTRQIRFILNDGVVSPEGIKGCPGPKDSPQGLCPLDTFVPALKDRIQKIDFNYNCLANYTVPTTLNITNGAPYGRQ